MKPESVRGGFARLLAITLVLLGSRAMAASADSESPPLTLYVSPAGNDAWTGTLPDAKADKSDGPLATLERARDRVREERNKVGGRPGRPVNIFLRGGRYELAAPFVLSPEDSGSEGRPVTFAAHGEERPILSGGRRVTGWQAANEDGREVWIAKVPAGLPGPIVREMWVDGHRRTRSRFPSKGYLKVESSESGSNWRHNVTAFHYHQGDVKAWPTATDAELIVMSHWVESRLPVKGIDEKESVISFAKQSTNGLDPNDVYFLEGAKDFLNEPGRWCQDSAAGTIRYLPMPGERPDAIEAIVPALKQVLRLEGDPAGNKAVEHIAFRGIGFEHVQWDLPDRDDRGNPGPSGYHQADVSVGGAVFGAGARDCVFDHCRIEHVGGYGLELARGCQHDKVTHCDITDLGAGGVKIGETAIRSAKTEQAFGNEISDCRITDGGCFYPSGVGAWFGQTYDNDLSHNEIANFYYSAISVGWTWGYGRSLAANNIIEANHVHHIGIKRIEPAGGGKEELDGPILSDMGGIYTLGVRATTIIRGNCFHDIAALKYGGWGIYFDEGSSDALAENNLVYRTTHGGLHQHYGKDNVFRNNILAYARDWQVQRTRPEDHTSFRFEHNIVYWDQGVAVSGNFKTFNVVFNHNDYWAFDKGVLKFADLGWEKWREQGMDADSIVADPRFIDPRHDNFDVPEDSPARKMGFEPFKLSDLGPRK